MEQSVRHHDDHGETDERGAADDEGKQNRRVVNQELRSLTRVVFIHLEEAVPIPLRARLPIYIVPMIPVVAEQEDAWIKPRAATQSPISIEGITTSEWISFHEHFVLFRGVSPQG